MFLFKIGELIKQKNTVPYLDMYFVTNQYAVCKVVGYDDDKLIVQTMKVFDGHPNKDYAEEIMRKKKTFTINPEWFEKYIGKKNNLEW